MNKKIHFFNMKKIIHIIILLLFSLNLIAQSSDQNYILSRIYQTKDGSSYLDQIQYFDGLGRPVETVLKAQSSKDGSNWFDLITMKEYDGVGREYRQWLPVPATVKTGEYTLPATFISKSNSFYSMKAGDTYPYTETLFESSPLNRTNGQKSQGAAWNSHPTDIKYQTNATEVVNFFVNANNQLERLGNYTANMLYKNQFTDEDGKTTTEYKDKLGQLVMKRSSSNIDTYYVYNDLGQLSYVLPPLAVDGLPSNGTFDDNIYNTLGQYAYIYKYDERGNNVIKRLPGCDSICMVYDKADRLILSQDGNQRAKSVKEWTVTKYDTFGRVLYTGILNNPTTRIQFKAILDNQIITETYNPTSSFYNTGYTCTGILTGIIPLMVNYYDNYSFLKPLVVDGVDTTKLTYDASKEPDYGIKYKDAKSLLTGTRTYILDKPISKYLTTAIYYDDRGQALQSRSTNQLGGYEIAYNKYDFTGKVLNTIKLHNTATVPTFISELYRNDYDLAGRLKTTYYQLNNNPEILLIDQSQPNSYDELGRIRMKKRHNGTDIESYTYNIRNWTTMIKSGAFEEDLFYNSNLPSGISPCYNGNISYSTWTYNGIVKGYQYTYDELNRLTNAYFKKGTSTQADNTFNEYYKYDKMGNITSLLRVRSGIYIDGLKLTYNGNQLWRIEDSCGSQNLYAVKEYPATTNSTSGPSLTYDGNGNLVYDYDRKIATIRYNLLNLPDTIQFSTGNQIINRYAADGRKLGTEYFTRVTNLAIPLTPGSVIKQTYTLNTINQNGIAYIDNKEYSTLNGNAALTALKRVYNAEGYAENSTSTNPIYNYYRKDHLGNIREVNTYGSSGPFNQRTQYYPSGLPWAYNSDDNPGFQTRKYNGKEFIEMHGYDTYDYGARGLQAALGRFTSVDPLAEKYYSISPYAYCAGNPVNRIDPDGRKITNSNGYVLSNRTLMEQLAKFDMMVSRISGLDRNSYSFNLTGGDRYRKNGNIYSATNNTIVRRSAKFSPHLRESGAFGVDLGFSKKISYQTIQAAAKSVGMRLDPDGPYSDNHFHLDIKNYKGNFIYEDTQYIPTDEDFIGHYKGDNRNNSIELNEVIIKPEKSEYEDSQDQVLDKQIEDMNWSSVKPNENGNTGRYNQPNRTTDQFYNDDFLKWYYDLK